MCQCTGCSTSAYRVQTLSFPHICHPSACGRTLLSSPYHHLCLMDYPTAGIGRIRLDNMVLRPLPLTRTDRLPAELMAQVLDNTKDDTQTLHACCLVCVAWHTYPIDYLYTTIRLRRRSNLHRLARAANIYPAVRGRLALAQSVILKQHDERAPGIANVFPLVLGPHLHNVQDLALHNCIGQPLHPSFFVKLRQLKDVKHLYLSGPHPQNLADFQRIVCAFPQLEELDIADLVVSTSKFTSPHVLNLPCISKLTCLRVSDIIPRLFRVLVVWLSSGGVCSTISSLNISLYTGSIRETGPLNTLLAHTASTLEHLRMYIPMKSTHSLLHARSHCRITCCRFG